LKKRRETLQYIILNTPKKIHCRRSLLEISLPQSTKELKVFLQGLDRFLLEKALEWARMMYKAILEQVDELVAEQKSEGLVVEHKREVWHQTFLGAVRVKRRQYGDGAGNYRYLLDELMGMGKKWHVTREVQELTLELAMQMPYRRCAEVLRKTSAVDLAHQTIWRIVGKIADPYIKKAEREIEWFVKTGEIPDGEGKKVARLLVEADGVMLSLQREKERKAEVKLGIAYEGWEKVGKDRYRTLNKTVFASVANGDTFWAGMTLKLESKYDLSRIGDTVIGGDGAGWVKEGVVYNNGRFQLDRYHLNRELCHALGRDGETRGRVWRACEAGDIELGLRIMVEAMKKAKGEQAQRIAKAYHYLSENSDGLADYRLVLGEEGKSLRRTGAIEGNIDKLVVRRMKNQGMSWTIRGIRRLLCVRFMVLEDRLVEWLRRDKDQDARINIPPKKIRRLVTNLPIQEPDDWLKVSIPALYGPHASRPWARALKKISEVSSL
jgi:hypothetical protein